MKPAHEEKISSFYDENRNRMQSPADRPEKIQALIDQWNAGGQAHSDTYELFKWIKANSGIPSLELGIDMPYDRMYEEGLRLHKWCASHRGSDGEGWKSLALHGVAYDKTENHHHYGYEQSDHSGYHWTIASEIAPVTTRWWQEQFPWENFLRVRFMYLEPGGYIMPHRDMYRPGFAAINVALNNPEGCEMMIEDHGAIPWKPGDVRYLDVHNKHAVWNRSDHLRIHMIAHSANWGKTGTYLFACKVIESYLREVS